MEIYRELVVKAPISAAVAIAIGLIVLLGYFTGVPLLVTLRNVFAQWAIIVAAVGLFVGIANLVTVHGRKVSQGEKGSGYSLLVLVALVLTVIVVGYLGPGAEWSLWIFEYIQLPIEMSLLALLAVVLVYAAARMLHRKMSPLTWVFIATVVIVLAGSVTWLGNEIPGLHGPDGLRSILVQVLGLAGGRGILIGVALGTAASGLRILLGSDRPYGGA